MQSANEEEKKFQSELVNKLGWIWIIVNTGVMAAGIVIYTHASFTRWIISIIVVAGIGLASLALNRLGHTKIASYVLPVCLFLHITRLAYTGGGTTLPGISNFIPIILTTGFLLGRQKGIMMAILCIAATFAITILEVKGMLPPMSFDRSPMGRAVSLILPISIATTIQYFATKHLSASFISKQSEILKREEAEKIKNESLNQLQERVKELKTLYAVSRILQDEDASPQKLYREIAEVLPTGWQYPDIAAARLCIAETEYTTNNYKPTEYYQKAEMKTSNGTRVYIEVVYLQAMPELDEGPFLKEERSLINMLLEMLKIDLEHREHRAELKDYKYALDIASIVSISDVNTTFTFVNENFCKASKYSSQELLGQRQNIIWSGFHSPEYFTELRIAMQDGKPYRGEFCNKAKDGTLYWVDTTIVPFLDENGKVYQYLSINQDITERKEAEEKIKQSEQLLKKITSQVPGNTYMFELEESGDSKILFMSRGTEAFNHPYDLEDVIDEPLKLREEIHQDDKVKFNDAMKEAYRNKSLISVQYRMISENNIRWRWMQAIPETDANGKTIWYGATSDITPLVEYIASIEQIIFDIGHVIRRPITSMMGMTKLILDNELSEKEIKEISQKLYLISDEMDKFIRELMLVYNQKRQNTTLNIDTSSLIDKRSTLFN